MMQDKIKYLEGEEFRRLTRIKPETFEKMLEILSDADRKKKVRGGRRNKLNLRGNRLLLQNTYVHIGFCFHIGKSYDLNEITVYKTVRWVEDTLIKHPDFALPRRKGLINDNNYDTILINATDTPIGIPKKVKEVIFWKKEEEQLKELNNIR